MRLTEVDSRYPHPLSRAHAFAGMTGNDEDRGGTPVPSWDTPFPRRWIPATRFRGHKLRGNDGLSQSLCPVYHRPEIERWASCRTRFPLLREHRR